MTEASTFSLNREMQAAQNLRAQIADILAADPDFLSDAIESETSLFEQIDALVLSIRQDETLAKATDDLVKDLQDRKRRVEGRALAKRAMIVSAMQIAEIPKRETPAGTVSIRAVPAKAIIVEEGEIPARFWEAQPPKLSTRALTEALRAGEKVPGASLSNGSQTIAIRS